MSEQNIKDNKMNLLFKPIFDKWDELNGGQFAFKKFLRRRGWKELNRTGCFKVVFIKDDFVLKFDEDMKLDNEEIRDGFDHSGFNGERSHTASEHRHWQRSKNIPERAKYICPSLLYHRGILIQPKLENPNDSIEDCKEEYIQIAKRLRFSHFWHYGFLDGQVKWFDVDHYGENWSNWKLTKDKRLNKKIDKKRKV